MTRDEFIQRAAISMAGKMVNINGCISDKKADKIAESAADLADAVEPYVDWD